ncbi:hypothetical protein CRE_10973 [Caenorhabditis remanei]|uniref:Sdz-33 F-box domain-containing protein n=1 Tax=Caenorhabditis remanei TaxID=31234 RepID=E3M5T2_CAERE|nr:hypothetical protein CRE_10973 [Caenorhabditis remanei]
MEIFELSQVSRRTLNYLNLARISVGTVHVVNGSADIITIFNESCTERKFVIEFVKTPQPVVGQMKVNDISINVWSVSINFFSRTTEIIYSSGKYATQKIILCNSNQFGYGLVHIMTHLDKIFYRMDIALGIELSILSTMRGILCHPIFRKCFYMQIRGRNEVLSNEDCDHLLKKTQPTSGITIFSKLSPDFDYKKIIHFSLIRVPNLGNMPLEDLKALNSEIANLGNHHFTENDINQFLNHWIEGNNRKLRRLKLDGFKTAPDWDILLKDIVYTEWDPRERGKNYTSKYTHIMETIDCEDGKDFRSKDGQLSTVVHHSEFLDFVVWNDKFPE